MKENYQMDLNDIDHWPSTWQMSSKDIAYGNKLIKLMKPFIIELAETLSPRTVKKHKDNLWLLGGYTINRINRDAGRRNTEPCLFLTTFIDSWDGPHIQDLSEQEQRSFDSTCKKFYRHLVENVLRKLS
jgi:hypothetical protein